ncbi:NAD(P)/FAD-dependent oxidoreductase [Comamonas thiooxydans]|uniref:NAD(P)/FAD-dependent oxidoreductase n=1 Tax=Comamonas thiooxydans TaxID=363952 RepID=A0AA42Q5R2_9BURK|nr:NAD(P)/FAD-dependent oxidoreductase [Comamonas thiooxydans]MDH1336644.1 NAD(P)/FAD-dependent oxidoreductase [Comamonas thiooxydans]MDH1742692.1 NAD(P)/FAD-dependent oxidoreductase [Comamonas thiooxydans]MDH1789161.1 NAD(P)/FAD-dependent oxidoreductase [Comamonas thiooxydans]
MNQQPLPLVTGLHLDFVVVGSGISGIGAAYSAHKRFPDHSFAVLEAMDGFGGTWWTHRYPGARSDSDCYTYGYSFKPWETGRAIGTAAEIRSYLGEVLEENHLAHHVYYGHKITAAKWSSQEQRWTLEVTRVHSGETLTLTTNFLWMCTGYYDHGKGYTPEWSGMADFKGQWVHPQHWPQDLDCTGKRVVVIGSGATAATLIPALADSVGHVTMLQRSPTFMSADSPIHPLETQLRALDLPADWVHEIMRRAFVAKVDGEVEISFTYPEEMRAALIEQARALLPEGFDVDKHFNPSYRPWQQRIALIPDGDLFTAIRSGKASVVTDGIERFDATGIQLTSGERLDADIVVTATGFNMKMFGDVPFFVDGEAVDFTKRVTYRGLMMEGIPNMAYVAGYIRSSWTLRADLVTDLVCRIVKHMEEQGHNVVVPRVQAADADMPRLPWVDSENLNSGYVMRALHLLPRQGDRHPWRHGMEYAEERVSLPAVQPDEEALTYR